MSARAARLQELRLRQFRNIADLELTLPAAGVAIIGENGSGKTNLLESIYYLEIFRSFRGAGDDQLVRFGAEAFHVRARLQRQGGSEEVATGFELRTRKKRVAIEGSEPNRMADAIGHLAAVIFSPADVNIVAGAPGERRRFLDILLSLNAPGYLEALQRYRQLLKQRNAALRAPRFDSAVVSAWDDALVAAGARITHVRADWVRAHASSFANHYALVSGGARGELRHAAGIGELDGSEKEESIRERFAADLARTATRERERGMTLVGPHRDDLEFVLGVDEASVQLRAFGSGGQVRTAAIVLRMIEAETIRTQRERDVLLLLDDIFAELDAARSQRILELLEAEQPGQVILTAPKESDIRLRAGQLDRWRIAAGQVFP